MPAIPSLEIRLFAQQGKAYPVEMTLAATQQVFRGQVSADVAAWTPSGDSRTDGQALFETLFTSAALLRGWGVAHGGQSKQVRVQLRIDAPELHTLPWELLRDDRDLLAAAADSPFSRYLAVSRTWGQAIAERPIRVLAVISNPQNIEEKYGLPSADAELEARGLREAINIGAQLTLLSSPITLDRLEAELRNGYHILHFVGHGVFNTKSQQAALYFQDASGNAQRVNDDDFTGMLNRLTSPPHLVILAACQSAKQSMQATFSGLGPKLVEIGLPAVIAMQENVTILTARQFTATFYQRLLAHGTVDLAMNEARGTLITNGRYDAVVPVLFMRLPDGRLWDVGAAKEQSKEGGRVMSEEKQSTGINTGGGAYIGGSVTLGSGSKFVGRDDHSTTGLSGDEVSKLFASIYHQIDMRPDDPKVPRADIKEAVEVIEAQVKQGENADEKTLGLRLKSLKLMAKDILDVVVATFTDPRLGIATVLRKVLEKAKA
jgi:CHAT domain-containing protein